MQALSPLLTRWVVTYWSEPPAVMETSVRQHIQSSSFIYKPLLAIVVLIIYNRLLYLVCVVKFILIMNNWQPREVKQPLSHSKVAGKKNQTSDSSNLEIIVTGNLTLWDLRWKHICYRIFITNLKTIDCHFSIRQVAMSLIFTGSDAEELSVFQPRSADKGNLDYNVIASSSCFPVRKYSLKKSESHSHLSHHVSVTRWWPVV